MVVERVAAGPVDQANVRIAVALAVVVETGAGLLQHVGDARHRDEGADGVAALRHRGAGKLGVVVADHVGGAVADAEAAAGQTDLAQHGGDGDQRPVRLFAVVRTLQRPGNVHHGARAGRLAGQTRDALGRYAGDGGGPVGGLGLSVDIAAQVGGDAFKADAVAGQEGAVVAMLGQQCVRQGQQQGGVGAGTDGDPLHLASGVDVVADRADVDEAHPRLGHAAQSGGDGVLGGPTRADLGVLGWHAAEADEQLRVPCHDAPAGVLGEQLLHGCHDVRHQHPGGAQAVGVGMPDVPADAVEKAVHLALRVVKAPCARPAVGAAENRRVAVLLAHAIELARHQIQRFGPVDLDEGIAAAPLARRVRRIAASGQQPAATHGGPAHTHRATGGVQHRQADRRGRGVA